MARRTTYPGIKQIPGGYFVRVTGVDPRTGKLVWRKREMPGAALAEAVIMAEQLREEIRSGGRPRQEVTTLTAYSKSWLQRRVPRLGSSLTVDRYTDALEHHILPAFGDWYVNSIDKVAIEEWMTAKRPITYSPETINGWWRILKDILRSAVVDLNLERDPTLKIEPLPVPPRKERNSLTEDELNRFLAIALRDYPQWYAFCCVGFGIGGRPGELRPLRWDIDLDLKTGHLVIQQSQARKHLGPTKNKEPREIDLPPTLIEILKWHRKRMIRMRHPGVGSGLIFPSMGKARTPPPITVTKGTDAKEREREYFRLYRQRERARKRAASGGLGAGGFISTSALQKPFEEIAKAAGIKGRITPKAMRRTFNDLARKQQVHDLVLRAVTGHRTAEMQNTYSTVAGDEKRAAVAKVVELFGGTALIPAEAAS